MFYVSDQLDLGQYGGEKGSSISHYLIEFVNFILYNQDQQVPLAVLAVMVDFSKAFNRINHTIVITILSKMGVPGWLLKIVIVNSKGETDKIMLKKSLKDLIYQNWFVPNISEVKSKTRSEKTSFKPGTTRYDRYFLSP